jgi:hypothetical protein
LQTRRRPLNYTVDAEGAKEVTIRSTDYEKQNVTVMLSITADGHKLTPHVILNRRIIPKNDLFPKDGMCGHRNWWMTADLMED